MLSQCTPESEMLTQAQTKAVPRQACNASKTSTYYG